MKATFIELPPFERHRQGYLNDESFREFQKMLMKNPEAGAIGASIAMVFINRPKGFALPQHNAIK